MENWSMAQLKAHQQFELGRVDSLRWLLDNQDDFFALDNLTIQQMKQDIEARIREIQSKERETQVFIDKILASREAEKQKRKDDAQETHRIVSGQQ